jgi:DNA-directed RNA polymerase subunit RPC12/RpoP
MAQRQCPECGSELVLTRRPDGQAGEMSPIPSTYWRCSVCGGEFTAEQIRKDKRDKAISA